MDNKNRVSSSLLIILFVIALCAPVIQKVFKIIPPQANTENRRLSDKPIFDVNLLDPFPAKYESYYNDHFVFRNQYLKLYSTVNLNLFGKCPYPDKVLIGKNQELFLVFNELNNYLHKDRFSKNDLDKMRSDFSYRKKYLESKGVEYYVAICPTKYSVYPELLPWYLKPDNIPSRTAQFTDLMNQLGIKVIDLQKAITKAKDSIPHQLYRSTDNHWNDLGAFVAYDEIMSQLSKKYPQLKWKHFNDYIIKQVEYDPGNLAVMLNLGKKVHDPKFIFTPKFPVRSRVIEKCPYPTPEAFDPNDYYHGFYIDHYDQPKILLIHDSFGNSIQPFIRESFSKSVFVWDKWQYKLNEAIVESEMPDIYVTLVIESGLQYVADNCKEK
jgi:alginate O-acetyltransferase complex protein AlgJ